MPWLVVRLLIIKVHNNFDRGFGLEWIGIDYCAGSAVITVNRNSGVRL